MYNKITDIHLAIAHGCSNIEQGLRKLGITIDEDVQKKVVRVAEVIMERIEIKDKDMLNKASGTDEWEDVFTQHCVNVITDVQAQLKAFDIDVDRMQAFEIVMLFMEFVAPIMKAYEDRSRISAARVLEALNALDNNRLDE